MNSAQKTYHPGYDDLNFDTGIIESLMGYNPGETDHLFLDMVEEVHREIPGVCDIRAEVRLFDDITLHDDGETLSAGHVVFRPGKLVCRQLRRSEQLAITLCTAGKDISSWVKTENLNGNTLKAYVIDLFGSEIVDAALDLVQDDLEKEMNKSGLKITNRYSPGYCEWETTEQHKLFSLFPDNFPGITLSASALMIPVKSVSCIAGIGKNVRYNPYTCNICDFQDCIYRERKDRRKRGKNER